MLVLSRMTNEAITIGDYITVMVVEICGHKAKLGVDAPRQTPVHRQEVFETVSARGKGVTSGATDTKEATRQTLKAELKNALIVLQTHGICRGDDILIALRDRLKSVLEG